MNLKIQEVKSLLSFLNSAEISYKDIMTYLESQKFPPLADFFEDYLMNSAEMKLLKTYQTPQRFADLMKKIGEFENSNILKIYDNSIGTGNLVTPFITGPSKDLHIFGQELNLASKKITQIILAQKGVEFTIGSGDTLQQPFFKEPIGADLILINPPFSLKGKDYRRYHITLTGKDYERLHHYEEVGNVRKPSDDKCNYWQFQEDPRFKGIIKKLPAQLDGLFLLDALYHLSETGKAVCLIARGLSQRNAEANLRKYLYPFIEALIYLPSLTNAEKFKNTSIDTFIVVLNKKKKDGFWVIGDMNTTEDELFQLYSEKKEVKGKCQFFPYPEEGDEFPTPNNLQDTQEVLIDIEEVEARIKAWIIRRGEIEAKLDELVESVKKYIAEEKAKRLAATPPEEEGWYARKLREKKLREQGD